MRQIKRSAAILIAMVIMTASILPACGALAENKTGIVKGGWLILRAAPSFSGQIKSSYPTGTKVTITGQVGAWYAVTTPDSLTGYMYGAYLNVSGRESVPGGTTAYVTSTNGLNVRLRSGPGKGYSILAAYAPGTKCTILSAGTNWCRIQIGSAIGYMMTCFLTGQTAPTPTTVPGPEGSKVWVTSKNGKGVNLRSGPGKNYSSIGFYSVQTEASMITKGSTWSYIRIGNRYGYMMTEFLTDQQPDVPVPPVAGAYVISSNGKNVNLRAAPTKASKIIKSFKAGTRLTVVTRGKDWCFILINGYYGYMMSEFIYDGNASATPTDLSF